VNRYHTLTAHRSVHGLSDLTVGKVEDIKTKLANMWRDRNKNHKCFMTAVDNGWAKKQENLSADLGTLIKESEPAGDN
jgi:hypothetical protein